MLLSGALDGPISMSAVGAPVLAGGGGGGGVGKREMLQCEA